MAYTYREIGTFDDYYKTAQTALNPYMESAKTAINDSSEMQKQATTDIYNNQIDNTALSYEGKYRENAVQKAINEREVAENMANLGLTNSGLNRTQQSAVQLSYANNKYGIDMQKQAAVDALARELANELSGIEATRISGLADVENQYNQAAIESATSQRNADIDYNAKVAQAESDEAQAEIDAQNKYDIAEMQAQNDYNIAAMKAQYDYNTAETKAQYDYAADIDTTQIEADTDIAKHDTDAYYDWVDKQEKNAEDAKTKEIEDGQSLYAYLTENNADKDYVAKLIVGYCQMYDINPAENTVVSTLLHAGGITMDDLNNYRDYGTTVISNKDYNDGVKSNNVAWDYKSVGKQKYIFYVSKDSPNWFGGVDKNDVVDIYYPDGKTLLAKNVKLKNFTKNVGKKITSGTNGNEGKKIVIEIDLSNENL